MPLSVPLKTSRTGKSCSKGAGAGTSFQPTAQVAAQLAAQSGAKADVPSASSSSAAAVPAAAGPPPPIPPVTGAVWGHGVSASSIGAKQAAAYKPLGLKHNTPQAVLRSFFEHEREREMKHWDSKGTQVVSSRVTHPSVSFHNGPSGRMMEEKARCREIGEHPMLENPGPEAYTVEIPPPICMVPAGWNREDRFKGSLFANTQESNALGVKISTGAHPLCPTFPYPEPNLAQPQSPTGEGGDQAPSESARERPVDDRDRYNQPRKGGEPEPTDEENRRNPVRTADLNYQYFKFKHKPTWGFGSSGLGARFMPGTAFAKQPAVKPHTRLRGFRELRDAIPERSEKEYQDALEKALASAASEAAAATTPAPPAPPPQPPLPAASPETTPKVTASQKRQEEAARPSVPRSHTETNVTEPDAPSTEAAQVSEPAAEEVA